MMSEDCGIADRKNSYIRTESAVDTKYSMVALTPTVTAVQTHYMAEVPVAHEVEIQSMSQLPVMETVSKEVHEQTFFKPALRLVSTTTLPYVHVSTSQEYLAVLTVFIAMARSPRLPLIKMSRLRLLLPLSRLQRSQLRLLR